MTTYTMYNIYLLMTYSKYMYKKTSSTHNSNYVHLLVLKQNKLGQLFLHLHQPSYQLPYAPVSEILLCSRNDILV